MNQAGRTTFHANELLPSRERDLEDLRREDPEHVADAAKCRLQGRQECFELLCMAAREAGQTAGATRQRKQAATMADVRLRLHQVAGAIRKGMVVGSDVPAYGTSTGVVRLPARSVVSGFAEVRSPLGRVYHCV